MLAGLRSRILNRSQKTLRTDVRYAVKGGFYLSVAQGTGAITALILTIAFANLLPPEVYGLYRYGIAAFALLSIAALPGIDTALIRAVSAGNETVLLDAVRSKFRWGLLGSAPAIMYAAYAFSTGDSALAYAALVVACAIPFMESLSLGTSFLNGARRFKAWGLIDAGTHVVSAATLVVTLFSTQSAWHLLIAYFLPYILIRAATVLALLRTRPQAIAPDAEMHTYGRTVTSYQVLTRLIASLDQIVLFHLLGPVQVAVFALATAIPNRIQSLLRITGSLAFPRFVKRDSVEIAQTLPRKMLLFGVGVLVVCGVYALLAPTIFALLFPAYGSSVLYSQVAVLYTLSAITYPFGSYLLAHGKMRENYQVALWGFGVKLTSLAVFVPLYGIWGAVIGLLANTVSTLVIAFVTLRKEARSS